MDISRYLLPDSGTEIILEEILTLLTNFNFVQPYF